MQETETFLNRIGRLFRRGAKPNGNGDGEPRVSVETNPLTLRPWRKNSEAISQLQDGFHSLTDLMDEIRQNMAAQSQRQDQLISHLSALPKLLEAIPENNRLQCETLKAIQEQLKNHGEQGKTLGDILERLSESGGEQRDLLEGLRERVETLNHQDKAMADSLNSVSAALEQTSRHSAAGTQVLETLRQNLDNRDGNLERAMRRQNERFTALLVTAVCVSVMALVAVLVVGYVVLHQNMK
jgi:chromosome segregation ATPase